VVHGPAGAVDPLVAAWALEHRGEFDVEVSADLVPWRKRGGVDQYNLTAAFLQAIRGWAWPLPDTFGGRVAEYRAEAARRKVLVRLGNADQAAQVRPWVAGEPGSVVLVTSRRKLGGLITEGAAFVDMTPEESQDADLREVTTAHGRERQPELTPAPANDGPPVCRRRNSGTPCVGEVDRYAFTDALGLEVPGVPRADLCEGHQADQVDAFDERWFL